MAKTVSAISLPEVQQQVDGDADQNAKARAVEIMSNLPDPIADTDAELGIERNDAWFDRVQELQKEYTKRVVEAKKLQAGHASNLAGVSAEFARQAIVVQLSNLNGEGDFIPKSLDGAQFKFDDQGNINIVPKTRRVTSSGGSDGRAGRRQLATFGVTHPDGSVEEFEGGQKGLIEYANKYAPDAGYEMGYDSKLWSHSSRTAEKPKHDQYFINSAGMHQSVLLRYTGKNDPINKIAAHHGHTMEYRDANGGVIPTK